MPEKLVCGLGIYDIGLYVPTTKGVITPEYNLWSNVLKRCMVGGIEQNRHPSYIGCSIHPDFIKFQDFAGWCNKQIGFGIDGYQLDKDILVPGNKVYGPDTCVFVPQSLNKLLTHNRSDRGMYPTGVSLKKSTGKYQAQVSINGKYKSLGYFKTPDEASDVYQTMKLREIHRLAILYKDDLDYRVYEALVNYTFKE